MKLQIVIRGYANGELLFEDSLIVTGLDNVVTELAEKHAKVLIEYPRHMVEMEFLDEPNPLQRFLRWGTDPSGMVVPVAVDLSETN